MNETEPVPLDWIKIAVFIYIIFTVITSEVFIDKVLGSEYSLHGVPTKQGGMLQGAGLVLGYLGITIMVDNNLI